MEGLRIKRGDAPSIPYSGSVVLCTPFYENRAWTPYNRSKDATIKMFEHYGIKYDIWEISGDSYIDRARNSFCGMFMDSDHTDMIFIDSDMEWEPDAIIKLLLCKAPIAGGDYPLKNNWEQYGSRFISEAGEPVPVDEFGNIMCSIIPSGFMRIRKEALQKIQDEYPGNWYIDPSASYKKMTYAYFERRAPYGEDTYFCMKYSKVCNPGDIVVIPDITLTHWGFHGWTGNLHNYLIKQAGGNNGEN